MNVLQWIEAHRDSPLPFLLVHVTSELFPPGPRHEQVQVHKVHKVHKEKSMYKAGATMATNADGTKYLSLILGPRLTNLAVV